MVQTRNNFLQGYRKRTTFGSTTKKKADLKKEMDEELVALDEINLEACWKIYRLLEDPCTEHTMPNPKIKNCRPNPYCIYRLGLEKFDKLQQQQKGGKAAEQLVRRNPNVQPCGLSNYGNFCYVNSFLQIWFNDLRFRQCIYDWQPHPNWVKPDGVKLDIQAVMNCLQRLFLTMQFTPFETTDAKDFIELLRLDNQQQDVQEFHTLFFAIIERNLEQHPNGEPVRAAIRELFQSRMSQNLYCDCGFTNVKESEYRSFPISIEGINSLSTAMEHFFQPEPLADYKCTQCGQTGQATKVMSYTTLPQVLIIQLNRYVFESGKDRHRKLRTAIPYPRILQANKLKQDAPYNDEYELCAVMIHEGQNAHCGHYYDIIRDPLSNNWFTYNDQQVKLENRGPGFEGKEPKEQSRTSADQRGCYALIYQRKSDGNEEKLNLRLPPDDVVNEVRKKLEDDFTRESKESSRSRQLHEYRITSRHSYLNNIFRELEVKDDRTLVDQPEQIAFIPTSLLTDLFTKEFEAVKEMRSLDLDAPLQQPVLPVDQVQEDRSNTNNANDENSPMDSHPPPLNQNDNDSLFSFDGYEHDKTERPQNASFDYALFEHIYAPEPLNDVNLVLCKHGMVPLDPVYKGELKAVRASAAQRLISEYNIRLLVRRSAEEQRANSETASTNGNGKPAASTPATCNGDGETNGLAADAEKMEICSTASLPNGEENQHKTVGRVCSRNRPISPTATVDYRFPTGADLCVECVKELKNAAMYRTTLEETIRFLALANREMNRRIYDWKRVNPLPELPPPENAVWVSVNNFKNYKKIALGQMEKEGRNATVVPASEEEPAEKRQKSVLDDIIEENGLGCNTSALCDLPGTSKQFDNDVQFISDNMDTPTIANILNRDRHFSDVNQSLLTADDIDCESTGQPQVEVVTEFSFSRDGQQIGMKEQREVEVLETPSPVEEEIQHFNEELLCHHGGLSPKVKRMWVTRDEWIALNHCLIKCCDPIPCTADECLKCHEEETNLESVRESTQQQWQGLYDELIVLVRKVAARKWESHELGSTFQNVVCREFLNKFKSLNPKIKRQVVEIPPICQECLLCQHGRPYLPFNQSNDEPAEGLGLGGLWAIFNQPKKDSKQPQGVPMMDKEWTQLVEAYRRHVPEHPEPPPIFFQENGQFMEFCDECFVQHNMVEEEKRYIYPEGADIYVKMKGDESEEQSQAREASSSNGTVTMTLRRPQQKNHYKIKMRSDQTVKDLKVELMRKTNELPNDQLLYLPSECGGQHGGGGQALDDILTLEQAHVPANNQQCPLILIVQQRNNSDLDGPGGSGDTAPRQLEKGFRDTALST